MKIYACEDCQYDCKDKQCLANDGLGNLKEGITNVPEDCPLVV